jgi:hypothetical protein
MNRNVTRADQLAASPRFRAFALVFSITSAILYVLSDVGRMPLFTFHPGTDRVDFGWAAARADEGPAMYWYGWLATSTLGATVLGGLAALLPARLSGRLPLALAWLVPLLLTPLLIYFLKFFWRW